MTAFLRFAAAVGLGLLLMVAGLLGTRRALPNDGAVAFVFRPPRQDPQLQLADPVRGMDVTLTRLQIPDAAPAFSQDGSQLAYIDRTDNHSALHITDLNGHTRALHIPLIYTRRPDWSPDGARALVVGRAISANYHVYVADLASGAMHELTPDAWTNVYATWSPDGAQIALYGYQVSGKNKAGIYVVDTSTREMRLVVRLLGHNASAPRWSPDGATLVFSSKHDGQTDIFTLDMDGESLTRLTEHPADDYEPAWSPDGAQIVFVSDRDRGRALYVLDLAAGTTRRLSETGAWQPTWGAW